MLQKIRNFIPLAIAITGICGLILVTAQQILRQATYDPQIQVSENVADALSVNKDFKAVGKNKFDIEKNLNTFVIVYDDSKEVTQTNAMLDGRTPELPKGVLDWTKTNGQDRLTWEPKDGVRIATIVTRFDSATNSGYVLSGRNMREHENRIQILTAKIALAWALIMGATLFATLMVVDKQEKK